MGVANKAGPGISRSNANPGAAVVIVGLCRSPPVPSHSRPAPPSHPSRLPNHGIGPQSPRNGRGWVLAAGGSGGEAKRPSARPSGESACAINSLDRRQWSSEG